VFVVWPTDPAARRTHDGLNEMAGNPPVSIPKEGVMHATQTKTANPSTATGRYERAHLESRATRSIDRVNRDASTDSAPPTGMPSSSGPSGHRSKPAVRAAGVGLLMSLLLMLFHPVPADAASLAGNAGQIGTVWVNGPLINAWDSATPLQNGTTFYAKNFSVGGITVGRSPSSFEQRVTVVSGIQRWDGSWVDIQSRTRSGVVRGTGTVSFPEWTWSPSVSNNRAFYRVVHVIYWVDSASGQLVAVTGVVPNSLADNRCSTKYFRCTSYTDSLNF
jgi:hypothetical protein